LVSRRKKKRKKKRKEWREIINWSPQFLVCPKFVGNGRIGGKRQNCTHILLLTSILLPLGYSASGNPPFKKPHLSMRVWV
jgi:hypothetical protein